jgi:c-di-GMP-binding flagellar brake protein YcgR
MYEGVDVNFTVKLKRADSENGMAFYLVDFPQSIRYLQRRSAFRVPVSAAKEIKVDIETPEKRLFSGELSDISAGGMCVRFAKTKELELSNQQEETQCCIHLPDKRKIRCTFKVCHSNHFEASNSLHIGGSFEQLDKIQRRTIERFVIELQRLARKTLAR